VVLVVDEVAEGGEENRKECGRKQRMNRQKEGGKGRNGGSWKEGKREGEVWTKGKGKGLKEFFKTEWSSNI